MNHSIPALALLAITLALAPAARAQECAEGRVSTPDTAGRCCWPAQSWSEEHGRCSGPPQCPTGLVAEGDRCVVPILSFPPMPGSYAPGSSAGAGDAPTATTIAPAVEATAWPESPPALEHAMRDPRIVRGTDEPLLLAGLLTFGGAYLASIVFALIDEAAQNCFSSTGFASRPVGCGSWGYAFIPVAGGMISGLTVEAENGFRLSSVMAFAAHLPAMLVQVFGIVLTVIADAGYTEEVVAGRSTERERSSAPQVSIAPHLSTTEGGVWLDVRF